MKDFVKKWVLPPGIAACIGGLVHPPHEATGALQGKQLPPEEKALLARNEALKDRHKGKRCFILGSGSSIKQQDLTKLTGEFVIGVSNAFVHKEFFLFRPRYHVLPPVFESHGELHPREKLILWLRKMEERTFDAEMFFHIGDKKEIDRFGLFKNRVIHWVDYIPWDEHSTPEVSIASIPGIWSVSEAAITVAIYLGFEQIYLLGIDHDWFNGLHVYFYDEKREHVLQPDVTDPKMAFADSEFQMRRHAYIFKKYKYLYSIKKNIFNANANPHSYVDVFPRVDYDSLFRG